VSPKCVALSARVLNLVVPPTFAIERNRDCG